MREILGSLKAETIFFFDYFLLRQSTMRERVRIDMSLLRQLHDFYNLMEEGDRFSAWIAPSRGSERTH
jgi:hypothetical protein